MNTEPTYVLENLLLVQSRPPSSAHWSLTNDRLTIGRDPSSDVFVDDSLVSRHHAHLTRHGSDWFIADAGSTNGTYVNNARLREEEARLRPGDRIRLGKIELTLRQPGPNSTERHVPAAHYEVGSQAGNINNVAGNQWNYNHESNLRYVANKRGRARHMIIWGLILFFVGIAVAMFAVLTFQNSIFGSFGSQNPPTIPREFLPLFAVGGFVNLLGFALFIFGLIARGGAKREARRLGAHWS